MKTRILFFAAMSIACTGVSAHRLIETSWQHSIAPTSLPDEIYLDDEELFYIIEHEPYEYDHSPRHVVYETSCVTNAMNENSAANTINWHALPPFQARYAPNVPTSWSWHLNYTSHQRLFWQHRRTR